jgi:hypothetical protein
MHGGGALPNSWEEKWAGDWPCVGVVHGRQRVAAGTLFRRGVELEKGVWDVRVPHASVDVGAR